MSFMKRLKKEKNNLPPLEGWLGSINWVKGLKGHTLGREQ